MSVVVSAPAPARQRLSPFALCASLSPLAGLSPFSQTAVQAGSKAHELTAAHACHRTSVLSSGAASMTRGAPPSTISSASHRPPITQEDMPVSHRHTAPSQAVVHPDESSAACGPPRRAQGRDVPKSVAAPRMRSPAARRPRVRRKNDSRAGEDRGRQQLGRRTFQRSLIRSLRRVSRLRASMPSTVAPFGNPPCTYAVRSRITHTGRRERRKASTEREQTPMVRSGPTAGAVLLGGRSWQPDRTH